MQVTFIGTSAGEGYPGFWCECPNCTYAREKGGKNVRGNTCSMIDDDILLDMNSHFFEMAPRLGILPSRLKMLLVTHPHDDHFAPQWLPRRAMPRDWNKMPWDELQTKVSPCFTDLPTLHVYGNAFVKEELERTYGILGRQEECRMEFHEIHEGEEYCCEDVRFTPVRSRHTERYGFAHSYIIERGGKTLLYATDTGGYDPDMMDLILSRRYDCVIMEGTFGLGARIDGHMNLEKNREMLARLTEAGVWKNGVNLHLTHICPHWAPPHDVYAPMLAQEGIMLAYDGEKISI